MNELVLFATDTENPEKNYNLAEWYDNQGHNASAHTYFLRAAERAEDKLLAYTSLLRASISCRKQATREVTEKSLIHSALSILPERPEAYYFLCLIYEKKQEWDQVYTYSILGLNCYDKEIEPINIPDYEGKYLLVYQKAISSWWWGKMKESRDLFYSLVDECWDDMNSEYRFLVEDKIMHIGLGPNSQSAVYYDRSKLDQLRFKFKNSDTIERSYSQVLQDIFVLSALDGKNNGTFLEIGGAKPFDRNNTALLEEKFNWRGVSIELDESFAKEYTKERPKTKVLNQNALDINYEKLLNENFQETTIDYLQLDIEPARNTYECMLKIPFDKYKFAVITYEHDYYIDVTRLYRQKSRDFLKSKGYVLVVNDISPDGISSFEDWWVHPDLVDEKIISIMKDKNEDTKNAEDYIFCNKFYSEFETDKYLRENFFPDLGYNGSTSKFSFMTNRKNTSWIVDNFYDNPDEIRKFALEQEFDEGGFGRGFIGRRTKQQFLFPNLKEKFEKIMGRKITAWQEHGMNGRFQIAWSGEPLVYHCDSQKWGGMLYLTPNAPYQCGTTLYAHKQTRARTYYEEGWDAAWSNIPGECHLDGTPWEPVDVLGNVYNRLVIFDASCIHSASEYFGTTKENARLWQMFFFDTD